jgi:hypothetical protein
MQSVSCGCRTTTALPFAATGVMRQLFKSVTKELRGIPSAAVKRILQGIDPLAENPRAGGCVKLSAPEAKQCARESTVLSTKSAMKH